MRRRKIKFNPSSSSLASEEIYQKIKINLHKTTEKSCPSWTKRSLLFFLVCFLSPSFFFSHFIIRPPDTDADPNRPPKQLSISFSKSEIFGYPSSATFNLLPPRAHLPMLLCHALASAIFLWGCHFFLAALRRLWYQQKKKLPEQTRSGTIVARGKANYGFVACAGKRVFREREMLLNANVIDVAKLYFKNWYCVVAIHICLKTFLFNIVLRNVCAR